MGIDWKDNATKDRLLAAIIASFGAPINCREVARIFGDGATYNAIENSLRKPKKLAEVLKAEAANRGGPAESPSRPRGKAPSTPKKTGGVKSGRIAKPKLNGSPIKKELKFDSIKAEIFGDENIFGSGAEADVDTTMDDDDQV